MYKKPFAVQAQNLLSKKDLKGLKTQVLEHYPGLDEKTVDELLPEGQVKVLKLDSRVLLYAAGDSPPVFFDVEGRGDQIFPTLHTLWQYPNMMLELTIHPEVSKYLLNGADMMLPGVLVPANGVVGFGTVTKGQPRCIKIDGNPYPIAVGKMVVNQTQMEKLKGKGLEVLHVYKDNLWTFMGKSVPNAGFTEKEDEVTKCADSSWKPGAVQVTATVEEPKPAEEGAAPSGGEAVSEGGGKAADAEQSPADWSQDDLLDYCLLQAFAVSIADDKSLPIEASELYEKHMKPSRPEGSTLDVKKSSHKQIGKYLNALRKAKVIDVVEKKGVISVTKVDREHKQFMQWRDKFSSVKADASAGSTASATAGSAAKSSALPPPQIVTTWRPTHAVENLFKVMGKGKGDLFTWDKALGVLTEYIENEGLSLADGARAKLNEELITALYRVAGGEKKDTTFPEEDDMEELERRLQDRMQEHTTVDVAGVGPITRKGPPLKIEISLSRKGAHNVTRICNLEAYGLDVVAIGEELKKKLNCTVHIEDMPGKNVKDKMMQLQGHVHQEFGEFLQERYGITSRFISVK